MIQFHIPGALQAQPQTVQSITKYGKKSILAPDWFKDVFHTAAREPKRFFRGAPTRHVQICYIKCTDTIQLLYCMTAFIHVLPAPDASR